MTNKNQRGNVSFQEGKSGTAWEKVWFVVKAAGRKEGITSLLLVEETLPMFGFHPKLLQPSKSGKTLGTKKMGGK